MPRKTTQPYGPQNQDIYHIHPPKTAGTSICLCLDIYKTHDPAEYIRDKVGRGVWMTKTIIGSIRNPYDRALSWFMYNTGYRNKGLKKTKEDFNRWVLSGMPPGWGGCREARMVCQEDFIEIKGECQCHFLVHFERIDEDWKALLDFLHRPFMPLTHNDPARDKTKPDYREWWSDEAVAFAAPTFEYFCRKYGYAFGDVPGHALRMKEEADGTVPKSEV